MSESRWPTATAEGPCPVCGHGNGCRVAPDATAAVYWRNGDGNGHANGTGYVGKVHCKTPVTPTKASRDFPTPEAAVEAATPRDCALADVWTYRDADGADVIRVARFDLPDGGKQFRPVHLTSDGWGIGDPPGKLPLYRLDELPATGPVYVVEGEKCTDAARSIGLPAVTSAHGSSAATKSLRQVFSSRSAMVQRLIEQHVDENRLRVLRTTEASEREWLAQLADSQRGAR